MPYNTVVLAGGSRKGLDGKSTTQSIPQHDGRFYKALIPVGGTPMLDRVLRVLATVEHIGSIAVVGPPDLITSRISSEAKAAFEHLIPEKESLMGNLTVAAEHFAEDTHLLVVTSDNPLLSRNALSSFLEVCAESSADFFCPVVSEKTFRQAFPGAEKLFLRFSGGRYTVGSAFIVSPGMLSYCEQLARRITASRKNLLLLLRFLGLRLILRYLFRRLTFSDLENRTRNVTGFTAKVVPMPHPELAMDVDKPEDLQIVDKKLCP